MTDQNSRSELVWQDFWKLVGRDDIPSAREMPLDYEIVHAVGTARLTQLIAAKRGLDIEIAFILGILHDYGRIITGTKKDHARIGSTYVRDVLASSGRFSKEETEEIVKAVANHSLKDQIGGPLEELIKDADVLDSYFGGRRATKPAAEARLQSLFREFDLS